MTNLDQLIKEIDLSLRSYDQNNDELFVTVSLNKWQALKAEIEALPNKAYDDGFNDGIDSIKRELQAIIDANNNHSRG